MTVDDANTIEREGFLSGRENAARIRKSRFLYSVISVIISFFLGMSMSHFVFPSQSTTNCPEPIFPAQTHFGPKPTLRPNQNFSRQYLSLVRNPYYNTNGTISLRAELSQEDADYGYQTCLGNEFGFQMEHAWCWDTNVLHKQAFPYPINPRHALANQTYLFIGDSMARYSFRGFVCVLEDCIKATNVYDKLTRHGQIEKHYEDLNITVKYEWAPLFHQIIQNLTEKVQVQENVFISAGIHQLHRKTTLVSDAQIFARDLDKIIHSGKIQNVFFQTAPRLRRAKGAVVSVEYVNGLVLEYLSPLYPKVILLNGRWPEPVYDMKDGMHSLSIAQATGVRFAWAKTWRMYGQPQT